MKLFLNFWCIVILRRYFIKVGGINVEVDKKLIAKCKEYDKYSFMELCKMYEKYLYSLCFSYVQNPQDALDLVQEIYIKIFKNIKQFDINMPFHPWIRKVSVNTCLNFKRGIKNNVISINATINNTDDEIALEDTLVSEEDVLTDVLNSETKTIIKNYLKEMPEEYRMVITLRYYEELSYNEISELMGKPLGTIKTDIYRAKAILKKKLKCIMEVNI